MEFKCDETKDKLPTPTPVYFMEYKTSRDMTVHFLRSCFSPFALFYSCSCVCVCTCVCECVRLCFLPLSLYSSLLCASAEIDPLLPPVSTYSQHTDQASSTWGRRECRSVCRCLCARVCVCVQYPSPCTLPLSLCDYTDGSEEQSCRQSVFGLVQPDIKTPSERVTHCPCMLQPSSSI